MVGEDREVDRAQVNLESCRSGRTASPRRSDAKSYYAAAAHAVTERLRFPPYLAAAPANTKGRAIRLICVRHEL